MEKILDVTKKYFEEEIEFTKEQLDLLKNVAKSDDSTNQLVSWLNDAIDNNEERTIEKYFSEAMDAYEYQLSIKETDSFVKDLKRLNPDVDIKLSDNYNSIDISKPIDELNIPDGFYVDENNFLTNKKNTALSVCVALKLNEKNIENKKEENENMREELNVEEDFLEENNNNKKSKKIRKPKFRIFKKTKAMASNVYNFFKNKFVSSNDSLEEELILDNDSDMEELHNDVTKNNEEETEENKDEKSEQVSKDNNKKEESEQVSKDNNKKEESLNKKIMESENTKTTEENKNEKSEQSRNIKQETLDSLAEKYKMLGYEIESRKEKASLYFNEHEDEIKNCSKKQLEKYASKLAKIKEIENEYSILGTKIEARRKFEALKIDQLFNEKYEKRDNYMAESLNNFYDLNQELELRKEKASLYFAKHEQQIKDGSKKQLEKYASKLARIKEIENELSVANTKYNSLRKDKEKSYNMLFR